jgi:hypothetical protein
MVSIFRQTHSDRAGGIDGLNLFFGALLGANLGTLEGLGLEDYVKLIVLLAGTVMTLRMVSVSERRRMVLATLAFYAVLLWAVFTVPDLQPEGLALNDLHKLVATIAIWVGAVLLIEYWPGNEPAPAKSGDDVRA